MTSLVTRFLSKRFGAALFFVLTKWWDYLRSMQSQELILLRNEWQQPPIFASGTLTQCGLTLVFQIATRGVSDGASNRTPRSPTNFE